MGQKVSRISVRASEAQLSAPPGDWPSGLSELHVLDCRQLS